MGLGEPLVTPGWVLDCSRTGITTKRVANIEKYIIRHGHCSSGNFHLMSWGLLASVDGKVWIEHSSSSLTDAGFRCAPTWPATTNYGNPQPAAGPLAENEPSGPLLT